MDSGEIVRSGSFAALVPVFSKIRIFALFFSPFITSVLPNTILIQSDRIPVARNQRISSAFPGEQGRGGGAWDEGRWRGTSRELNIPPGQAVRRALDFTDSNQHAPPTHACFNIKKKKDQHGFALAVRRRAGRGGYHLCVNISAHGVSGVDESPRDEEEPSFEKSHLLPE